MAEFANTLLLNGKIATLDAARPFVEALAIQGARIVAVGSGQELAAWRGPRTSVIDVQGRTVIPGLNDAHTHVIRTGLNYAFETRWDGVPSLAEALARLREQARRTPPPLWVQVLGGWSAYQFHERRLPTLEELNAAAPDTPAYVLHLYDRAWINRAGLAALGWGHDTPEPPGGVLERDGHGRPTGLIVAKSSLLSVLAPTLRFPAQPPEQRRLSTLHFMRELNRLGVTSVNDAGGGGQAWPEQYGAVLELARAGQLTVRIGYTLFAQRPGQELADYQEWVDRLQPGQGSEFLRLSGGGEWLVWAAADPASFAWELSPQPAEAEARLEQVLRLLAERGWPFRLHATYDATARHILAALERVQRDVPLQGLRWCLDHAEGISPASLERLAALGGGVSIQNRMSLEGEAFLARQGAAAAADAPPIARMRRLGLPLSCGTDGTRATSYNPWVGLHWLVTGKTLGGTKLNGDANLLERMDALRMFTAGGAWFTREEQHKGALVPGMLADLAVLSADYFSVQEEEIKGVESVLTLVGGKVVHGSGAYTSLAPPLPPSGADWLPIHHAGPMFTGRGSAQASSAGAPQHSAHPPAHRHGHLHGHSGAGSWSLACGCGG